MPRKRSKPRKPYEKRIDLNDYQRLLRFLRWMAPAVSAVGVLRMVPESDRWREEIIPAKANILTRALRQAQRLTGPDARVSTLEALIPYIVCGRWAWPETIEASHWMVQAIRRQNQDNHLVFRRQPASHILGRDDDDPVTMLSRGLPQQPAGRPPPSGAPVWLGGQPPTVEGLCQVADDVRHILQRLMDESPLISDDTFRLIGQEVNEGLTVVLNRRGDDDHPPPKRISFVFTEAIRGHDFQAYCFWQVARLLVQGHAWRLIPCVQCRHVFLKTRQDPSSRPSRFCGDGCRRAWHNARRPKKGKEA
jgi:hypothetical protein